MQTEYTYQLNVNPLVVSDFCEDILRINSEQLFVKGFSKSYSFLLFQSFPCPKWTGTCFNVSELQRMEDYGDA